MAVQLAVNANSARTFRWAEISISTAGDHIIIATPVATTINIVHLTIQNVGGVQMQMQMLDGTLPINGTGFSLNPHSGYTYDSPDGSAPITLTFETPFIINTTPAGAVMGLVVYYLA